MKQCETCNAKCMPTHVQCSRCRNPQPKRRRGPPKGIQYQNTRDRAGHFTGRARSEAA